MASPWLSGTSVTDAVLWGEMESPPPSMGGRVYFNINGVWTECEVRDHDGTDWVRRDVMIDKDGTWVLSGVYSDEPVGWSDASPWDDAAPWAEH